MMKPKHILTLLFVILLAACSIDVSDGPPANTPAPVETSVGTSAETTAPPTSAGEEVVENETPQPSETTDSSSTEPAVPTEPPATLAPPAWADLGLEGTIYYVAFIQEQQNLRRLNLETGEEVTIFDPPENAWLSDIAVSPDGQQIVMAYGPPPEEGQVQFGFTDLYLLQTDGSAEPRPLLERAEASETYFNVSWPLDDTIYYAHFAPSTDDLGSILYVSQVERFHLSSEEVEVLAPASAWPRLSSDGTKLAYVTDNNEFMIAEADGSNPNLILSPESFPAVDAPLFSPDGQTIYFSAIEPEQAPLLSFLDRLMGVKIASAHNVPSDWWRMPADGSGTPERLTNIYEIGMYGDFGPDDRYIAFITASGVQIMNPDGTGVFRLKSIAATGTMNWVP